MAAQHSCKIERARLERKEARKPTISGQWMLRSNHSRHLLGHLWSAKVPHSRRLAMAITHTFPVQATLFKWGKVDSPACPHCRKKLRSGGRCPETVTHMASVCPRFRRSRTRAGQRLSSALHSWLETTLHDTEWQCTSEQQMRDLALEDGTPLLARRQGRIRDADLRLGRLKPDSVLVHERKRKIYLIECSRTMDNRPDALARRYWQKRMKYLDLAVAIQQIRRSDPPPPARPRLRWTVEVIPVVMGVKSSLRTADWDKLGFALGIPQAKMAKGARLVAQANFKAFIDLTETRLVAKAKLASRQAAAALAA